MQKYKLFARLGDIVAVPAKDRQLEKEYLYKGYTLLGTAKTESGFSVMGVRIADGCGKAKAVI